MKYLTADMISVVCAYGAFLLAYVANILFSLYLNIELLNHSFDRYKIGKSIKKAMVLVFATLMLVLAVDVIVIYFSAYIPELNEEIKGLVTVVAIVATIGRAAIAYLVEAYETFKNILEIKVKPSVIKAEDQ